MRQPKVPNGEGVRIGFAVLEVMQVLLRDASVRVEQDKENTRPVLGGPRGTWREAGNNLVSGVFCRLVHLCESIGVVKKTRDVLENSESYLQKNSKTDCEIPKVAILASGTTLGTGAAPVGAGEASDKDARELVE